MSPPRRGRDASSAAARRSWAGTVARLSAALLGLFVVIQTLRVGFDDPYKCNALLNGGGWAPEVSLGPGHTRFEKWEPSGCMMHEYTRDEFSSCVRDRRVVFIGDSTTRQLFWAAATRLDHKKAYYALLETFVSSNPQHDLELDLEGVKLQFVWDPWLNSTGLRTELLQFHPTTGAADAFTNVGGTKEPGQDSAALLVLGTPGLWAARHGGDDYFAIFKNAVEIVRPFLKKAVEPGSKKAAPYKELQNQILLAPVQVPDYEQLAFGGRKETLTPERINHMNRFLRRLPAAEATHVLWPYNDMTANVENAFHEDGFHIRDGVGERRIDIPLNIRCNSGLVNKGFAGKTTCCAPYPRMTGGQRVVLLAGVLVIPFLLLIRDSSSSLAASYLPQPNALRAWVVLVFTGAYCYLADRTHVFAHAEKHFSIIAFIALVLAFAIASAFSSQKSSSTLQAPHSLKEKNQGPAPAGDPGFMPRTITDEWKGFMQALFLILSYQRTLDALWAHKLTWLFMASYIFLSAYGHASYFLRTDDYSFRRVATVLFRLNALPCLLSLVLRADWILYGFPRLISFWFMVTFVTLRVWKSLNSNPVHLFAKVLVSAVVLTIIIEHGFVQLLGRPIRAVLHITFQEVQIRNQLSFNRFIPFFGILIAGVVHRCSVLRNQLADRSSRPKSLAGGVDKMLALIMSSDPFAAPIRPVVIAFGIASLVIFFYETQKNGDDGPRYRLYHPLTSIVPIVAYTVIRSSYRCLRAVHLELPAKLARISLETHLLHHHVWLAGDGTAILRTGLFTRNGGWASAVGWNVETLVITIVFLWASYHAQKAALALTAWIVGDQDTRAAGASSDGLLGTTTGSDDARRGSSATSWIPSRGKPQGLLRDPRVRVGALLLGLWAWNMYFN